MFNRKYIFKGSIFQPAMLDYQSVTIDPNFPGTSNLGQVHFVKRIWDGPTSLPWWTRKPWNYDHSKRPPRDDALGFGGMDLFREKQATSSTKKQQTNTKQ